jgi:hypothetical protein
LPQKCSTFVVGINFDLMKRTYIAFVLMCMYMLVTKESSFSLLVLLVACCQCAELVSCKLRETTNQSLSICFISLLGLLATEIRTQIEPPILWYVSIRNLYAAIRGHKSCHWDWVKTQSSMDENL